MSISNSIYQILDAFSPKSKSRILLASDLLCVILAFFLAFALRLNEIWPARYFVQTWQLLILLLSASVFVGYFLSNHAIKLRSYEITDIRRLAAWALIVSFIGTVANLIFDMGAPRTVPVIFGLVVFFFAFAARFTAVALLNWLNQDSKGKVPVAIFGAGSDGLQLAASLRKSDRYRPVLFVDDSKALQRMMISGLRVRSPTILAQLASKGLVKEVFLAIPSLPQSRKNEILKELKGLDCTVSELPSYESIVKSGGLLSSLQPVEADKLLGRDGVDLNVPELGTTYTGANILVSGAGGSIGSELCRKLLVLGAAKIVLFEQSELALYIVEKELQQLRMDVGNTKTTLIPVLGSITDAQRVRQVFEDNEIEIVLHSAAYKHVPLVESNKCAGVHNNVIGTQVLAQAAVDCGISRFIMISTDKAVRPTGTMGASKRLAELVIQDIQSRTKHCVFAIVRFGNVLGSSGSVIPLFRKQIETGGPITLTHPDVTRYFMTIHEAAYLVLLAGTYAENGEVFVLDMGEPIRIEDLAKRMITLSGLSVLNQANPDGDIEIKITGLRVGEKLYEELLIGPDNLSTPHPKIMRAKENTLSATNIGDALNSLNTAIAKNDAISVEKTLRKWVEGFGIDGPI